MKVKVQNNIVSSTAFYGLATGINRGASLLYLPILMAFLSVEMYGIFSLIQTLVVVSIPFISLNGGAAIMREGAESKEKGFYLLKRFSLIIFCIGLLLGSFSYFLTNSEYKWTSFVFFIALGEGLILLLLNWFRANEKYKRYLLIIFLKVIALLVTFQLSSYLQKELNEVLFLQAGVVCLVAALFWLREFFENQMIQKPDLKLSMVLSFTLFLIPHGISQWIMSSSDRIIIKYLQGNTELGTYSIAYTIGLTLMLINSGIALALPQHMIKNYTEWCKGTIRKKGLALYSALTLVAVTTILLFLKVDETYFQLLGLYDKQLFKLLVWILAAIYLLGVYYFYANYLFYHKLAKKIATQTFIAAIVNVTLTYALVSYVGTEGAAFATFLSYLVYLCLVIRNALKVEPTIKRGLLLELGGIIMTVLLIISIFKAIY